MVDKLNALDADLKEKQANKAKLQADVALCTVKLERAQQLITGLGGEKTRWTANAERLGSQYAALTGDTLLAAAFIAYLGAFTAGYRGDATNSWAVVRRRPRAPRPAGAPQGSACVLTRMLTRMLCAHAAADAARAPCARMRRRR